MGYEYKDIRSLSAWLRALLAAGAVLSVFGVVSGYMERTVLTQIAEISTSGGDEASIDAITVSGARSDFRQMIVDYAQVAVAIPTILLFAIWIYSAARNCWALSKQQLHYTPGWSLGWFFIPVMNVWKPYQAMRQTWNISNDPDSSPDKPAPSLLMTWWVLFLVSSSAGRAAFRLAMRAEEIPELLNANLSMLISDAMDIPAHIAAFMVIGAIASMQSITAAGRHPLSEQGRTTEGAAHS